jgi:hypothetical protein
VDHLAALLDAELAYDPVTAHGFSDHLPMALVALHRLGASDARLDELSGRYVHGLLPVRPEGQAARAVHDVAIARDGIEPVVRSYLPGRLPGIGSAAFHCVIRLAYALEAGHAGQVAAALAYWDEADEPLGAAPLPEASPDPVALLGALAADPALGCRSFGGGSISEQMARVAATPEFAAAAGLRVGPDSLADIAAAARALLAATGDFTALHAVTGTHAVRVVLPLLDPPARDRALRFLFQAVAAAYVTIGTPPVAPPAAPVVAPGDVAAAAEAVPSWAEIAAAAVANGDEHVVKLAYSAREEAAVYGDDTTYRRCAALHAGLVS